MMDPGVFGRQLERIMAGNVDDPFWLANLEELSAVQLGALYVALRLAEQRRRSGLLDRVLSAIGLARAWVVNGRGAPNGP